MLECAAMKFTVEHIGLAAGNPTALKDWYVRVLGAKILLEIAQQPPAYFVELSGGLVIEIYASDSATLETSNNRLAGWRHLALRVEAIEPARDQLQSLGVEFSEPIKPAGGSGRILFFKDAEGNLLHLVERPGNPFAK
jgi:glyoxylase I family protein